MEPMISCIVPDNHKQLFDKLFGCKDEDSKKIYILDDSSKIRRFLGKFMPTWDDSDELFQLFYTTDVTHSPKTIECYKLQLRKFPDVSLISTGVTQLILIDCNLREITDDLTRLQSLKVLFLSENLIQSVPESLSKLTNLEHLDLSYNYLESITYGPFSRFRSLTSLVLKHNHISRIDYGIFPSLKNLSSLDITKNRLSNRTFPHDICTLSMLTELDISNNLFDQMFPMATLPRSLKCIQGIGHNLIKDVLVDDLTKCPLNLRWIRFCSECFRLQKTRCIPSRNNLAHCISIEPDEDRNMICRGVVRCGFESISTCVLLRFSHGNLLRLRTDSIITWTEADIAIDWMSKNGFTGIGNIRAVQELYMMISLDSKTLWTGHLPTELRSMIGEFIYERSNIPGRIPAILRRKSSKEMFSAMVT